MKKLKWPVMLLATVASGVICFLGIPILLNWLFKTPAPAPVLAAEWSAGDALGYVGGTLAFIGAMFLGWNTWKQNRDLQNVGAHLNPNNVLTALSIHRMRIQPCAFGMVIAL